MRRKNTKFIASLLSSSKCITRKLSYRKDYRAMRPTYGCSENFWESIGAPHGNEILNGLLFIWSILWMKFVALPVPETIGVYSKKFGQSWIRPRSLF